MPEGVCRQVEHLSNMWKGHEFNTQHNSNNKKPTWTPMTQLISTDQSLGPGTRLLKY
jgi:hypothetical protein